MKPKYKVTTKTRGVLEFTELPESTYFCIGNIGNHPQSQAGEAAECQEGVVFPSEQVVCGWSVEDILVRAEDDEVELTKTEAREILDRIMHKADMSVGVNWDTISYFIREYCEKRD